MGIDGTSRRTLRASTGIGFRTDADTTVPPEWLSQHLSEADRGAAAVAGIVRADSFSEHPAALAAHELRPLYERYRQDRPVYALDLPGFGSSERVKHTYTVQQMVQAIQALADEIRRRHNNSAIDALAVSVSADYLARAVSERPEAFASLALDGGALFYHPLHHKVETTCINR